MTSYSFDPSTLSGNVEQFLGVAQVPIGLAGPLLVPGQCTFRVGNEVREWQKGRAWLFDDTIEHEAWNRSGQTRVILLFDVWRPELTLQERALVVSLFESIDAHDGGRKPDWEI